MKKTLILVGLFFIALSAGLLFAHLSRIILPNSTNNPPYEQVRYLIIRVDDLSKPRPTLQTVWGAIASFTDFTSLYLTPIYPALNNRADLAAQFSLTEQRFLSETFLKALEKYDLNLTGYVIVDDIGEQIFLKWALPKAAPKPGSLVNQRENLTQLCLGLNQNSYQAITPPDWKRIFPDHLVPSPNIESIMILFDRIFYRSTQVQCQVVD